MATAFEIYNLLCNIFPTELSEIVLKKLCISRMRDYLESKSIDPNVLFDLLIKYNCVISGSFPLNCLVGQPHVSDIDIYGKFDESDVQRATTLRAGYPVSLFEEELYRKLNATPNDALANSYPSLSVKYVRNYNIDKRAGIESRGIGDVIQYVSVDSDPVRFINTTFDFSFCKVIFNGKELYVHKFHSTIKKEGTIENIAVLSDLEACTMIKDVYDNPWDISNYDTKSRYGRGDFVTGNYRFCSKNKYFNDYHDKRQSYRTPRLDLSIADEMKLITATRSIKYKIRGFTILFAPLLD